MRSKRQLICEVHPNHMPVILDNLGSKSHITVASRFFLFTVDCCWLLTTVAYLHNSSGIVLVSKQYIKCAKWGSTFEGVTNSPVQRRLCTGVQGVHLMFNFH